MRGGRDVQQRKLYAWEGQFVDWLPRGVWSTSYLKKQAAKACRIYRVPCPKIVFLKRNRDRKGKKLPTYYDPDTHTIVMCPRHHDLPIMLHETAHAIVDWICGPFFPAHGPRFVGVYMYLLSRFKVSMPAALQASARQKRLRFEPESRIGPRRMRKTFRHDAISARRARAVARLWQKMSRKLT